MTIKEITGKLDCITFKNFFYYSNKRLERQATTRGKIFATYIIAKGLIFSICNKFLQIKRQPDRRNREETSADPW